MSNNLKEKSNGMIMYKIMNERNKKLLHIQYKQTTTIKILASDFGLVQKVQDYQHDQCLLVDITKEDVL